MVKEKDNRKRCTNCSSDKEITPSMYGSHNECRLCTFMLEEVDAKEEEHQPTQEN